MSQPRNAASILLAMLFLGGLVTGAFYFFRWLFSAIGAGEEPYVAIVVAVLVVVVVLVAGIRRAGRSKETDPFRFEKKAAAYQRLIDVWAAAISDNEFLRSENERLALETALREVTLWGSSEVIRHLRQLSQKTSPIDIHDTQVRAALENVLRAMRRDLGQNNLVLQKGDLLNLLVRRDS